ncbi:MAG: tRNA (adenosine(37)-N6)-threonylcarbamoyltransferase complex dimerization subunit type 1 TsaB [Tepidisphaeraceae bacterium]|jgi:tRNA threonylcarbamoyladenosine biosynthesis protein TsaB
MSIRALAIETSSRLGSVALAEDGNTLLQDAFPHGLSGGFAFGAGGVAFGQHAARIIPAIDALCGQLQWTPRDIREIYVSAGPGSFTGLRIGITLAKTLAWATGAALVAVPSVRVLADNAPADAKNVVIVLDAKRDQIFTASFARLGDDWTPLQPAQLCTLPQILAKSPRPVHLLGEGIPYHRKFIPASDREIHIADESLWRPQARIVASLGWQMAREGNFTDALALIPIYIRRPEAEEKLDGPSL